jgi:uncharacterized protein (DUF488 family)
MIELYTIGHGSRKANEFISLLKRYDIEVVIDVRTYPYSRFHPQFRRKQLEDDLKSVNIEYLFLGRELGGRPKDQHLYQYGKLNHHAVKQTKLFQNGIAQVLQLLRDGIKVTLICAESDPNHCHRKHLLADEFLDRGIGVIHINKLGQLEKHVAEENLNLFN